MSSTNNRRPAPPSWPGRRDAEESWDSLIEDSLSDSEWLAFHGWPGHKESFATLVRSYFHTHPDQPTVRQCINLAHAQRDKERELGHDPDPTARCWHCGDYFDKCQCGTT